MLLLRRMPAFHLRMKLEQRLALGLCFLQLVFLLHYQQRRVAQRLQLLLQHLQPFPGLLLCACGTPICGNGLLHPLLCRPLLIDSLRERIQLFLLCAQLAQRQPGGAPALCGVRQGLGFPGKCLLFSRHTLQRRLCALRFLCCLPRGIGRCLHLSFQRRQLPIPGQLILDRRDLRRQALDICLCPLRAFCFFPLPGLFTFQRVGFLQKPIQLSALFSCLHSRFMGLLRPVPRGFPVLLPLDHGVV